LIDDLPFIDFDEVPAYVARTRIGGVMFLVPPMPASAMAYFVSLQDMPRDDDGKAIAALKEFIARCFDPAQRDDVRNALDDSPVTLPGLMRKGTELMMVASGVPPLPPSTTSPDGSSTNGGISTGPGSGTVAPGSTS
jgi:hypothetical protein